MSTMISLEIPSEVLHVTRMTVEDLRRELAVHLFAQNKLSFGKAREMANMSIWAFQELLGSREISIHYDIADYEDDIQTLKDLGQL